MADWEEIKRLAADFQRTQTSDTLQRITERNCIDIVKKLTELNLIELIYTCDGKEFLTPSHLLKEIEDEVYVNGGRMHLHDLASTLNVDYQHIENKARDLAKDRPDEYSVILGQIIHSTYKNTLGKQISDCMLINGQLSIADFAKSLDLPSEFLLTIVREVLPKVIDDYVVGQDERTYYTTDMMDKYKSIIAGSLSAIRKPTSIATLLKRLEIPERIFMPTIEGLIKDGRIEATIENRQFIPAVFAREQNDYINTFYNSNSYINYDVLLRMDIKQPKTFLKKRFPDCMQLKTCVVGPNILSLVESLIEECIEENRYININTNYLPSAIGIEDIELLLLELFKKNKQFNSSAMIFNKTNVCSMGFIATCKNSFAQLMQTRAQEELKQGKLINHFLGGRIKETSKNVQVKEKEPETVNTPPTTAEKAADKSQLESGNKSLMNDEEKQSNDNDDDDGGEKQTSRGNRGNKDRKDRKGAKAQEDKEEVEDSDQEDQGGKKSGRSSRKSGGGTQGREIKQKAVKKKYNPGGGKGKRGDAEGSDEEFASGKTPRSNKGRAARRAMSPERPSSQSTMNKSSKTSSTPQSSKQQQQQQQQEKEPLIFMKTPEIIQELKVESRGSDEESTEEFLESVAQLIEEDLNSSYRILAKQILDEFLKSQSEETEQPAGDVDVELIE